MNRFWIRSIAHECEAFELWRKWLVKSIITASNKTLNKNSSNGYRQQWVFFSKGQRIFFNITLDTEFSKTSSSLSLKFFWTAIKSQPIYYKTSISGSRTKQRNINFFKKFYLEKKSFVIQCFLNL
jgi:hypothetical protein